MPIDYSNYPKNWKTEIQPKILERAENCCEFCGIENKAVYIIEDSNVLILEKFVSGIYICPDGFKRGVGKTGEWVLKQVILTIAHLNHDITDNRMENLKALCQKCHLDYDKEYRKANRKNTLEKKKGIIPLF